jgi:hypothetical protein
LSMMPGSPPGAESWMAAQPNTTDASARGGEARGRGQRPIDEGSRSVDQLASGPSRWCRPARGPPARSCRPSRPHHEPSIERKFRKRPLDGVEGVVEEAQLARRSSTAAPAQRSPVEQVHLVPGLRRRRIPVLRSGDEPIAC